MLGDDPRNGRRHRSVGPSSGRPRGRQAPHLDNFAELHKRLVQILGFLHVEKARGVLTIDPAEVRDKIVSFDALARRLDTQLFRDAGDVSPLYPRM
jgi:hypothetical protein